ncbi:hypothetical protein BH20ACT14_BH20ACT14_06390 [soil metagenome]
MIELSPDIYLLAEHFPKPVNSIQLSMTDKDDRMTAGDGRVRHLLS